LKSAYKPDGKFLKEYYLIVHLIGCFGFNDDFESLDAFVYRSFVLVNVNYAFVVTVLGYSYEIYIVGEDYGLFLNRSFYLIIVC
jgi:hypothetical protein